MSQHNYKYLVKAVDIVCEKKYAPLLDINVFLPTFNVTDYVNLVLELKERLAEKLKIDAETNDTLLSKIMLGTLGCVPAYDRNVRYNLGKLHICKRLSQKGLEEIVDFSKKHEQDISNLQTAYSALNYSVMKIVDCALWV